MSWIRENARYAWEFTPTMAAAIENKQPGNGWKFTIWLAAMYIGVKGFWSQMINSSITYYLRNNLGVDSQIVSEIQALRRLPWSMKPGFAFISDLIPFLGYKKRSYVFVYASVGATAACCLLFLPADLLRGSDNRATIAGMCFFFTNVYTAAVDVLTQGQYTVILKLVGPSILTFVFFTSNSAQLIVLSTIGYINEIDSRIPVAIAAPFGIAATYFAFVNYMCDPKSPVFCGFDSNLFRTHFKTIMLAGLQVLCTGGLLWMTLNPWWSKGRSETADGIPYNCTGFDITDPADPDIVIEECGGLGPRFRLYYCLLFSVVLIGAAFWALPPMIAKANAYLYLCKLMALSAGGALTFFYTKPNNGDPCPNTPGFDLVFYSTYAGFADKFATLAAIILFQRVVSKWRARPAFWLTTVATCVAALFDIIIVERWNIAWGIGDRAMYFFGSTCIEGLTDTLDELPATMLISHLCPKDVETTVFAILIAMTNLGGNIAGYISTDVQVWLNVKYADKVCDNPVYGLLGFEFSAMSWILIIGNIILPLMTIPLTWVLIPDVPLMTNFEDLDDSGKAVEMGENPQGLPLAGAAEPSSLARSGSATQIDHAGAEGIVKQSSAYLRMNTREKDDML